MAAGIIDHEAGTRDMRRLSGLFRFLPVTGTLAMVAAAAMAGVPLLNGFLSKEMFFTETVEHHVDSILDQALPYVATLYGMFAVAYSVRFIHQVFFGPAPTDLPRTPHEPPHWMRLPIELLVLVCLLVGIIPALTIGPYLATAIRAVVGPDTPSYNLAVWHGITPAFVMSIFALAGGTALYAALLRYPPDPDRVPLLRRLREHRPLTHALETASLAWNRVLEYMAGPRGLQTQLRLLVLFAILAAFWPLHRFGAWPGTGAASQADAGLAIAWLVGAGCAISAAWMAKFQRLAALIMMGGAGLVTCVTFAWFSAPDLALTQLLVEIVTVVLILLGLRWLPKRLPGAEAGTARFAARTRRLRDLGIAIVAGGGLALLAYAVMVRPRVAGMSHHLVENAKSGGGGENVVNVVLVDFRGFDTFGEITVLGAVALTVFALLRRFRPPPESVPAPEQQRIQDARDTDDPARSRGDSLTDYLRVPSLLMRLLFPMIGIYGAHLFLRGHHLPGGGFVGGLTLAIAVILQYMAGGTRWIEARLRVLPLRWMGSGLLLAAFGGIGAWWFGYPFLTSHTAHVEWPILGEVTLASATLFDLGVLLLVVGATILILIALAHQSLRSERAPQAPADPVPTEPLPANGPRPVGAGS
jgi:multicomponent K+:H+ antiporter subunit A